MKWVEGIFLREGGLLYVQRPSRVCVHVVEVDKGVSAVPGAGVRRAWVPASVHTCLAV